MNIRFHSTAASLKATKIAALLGAQVDQDMSKPSSILPNSLYSTTEAWKQILLFHKQQNLERDASTQEWTLKPPPEPTIAASLQDIQD